MLDRIIMIGAFGYWNVWHRLRCQLFRRIEDFNYHVFAIPQIPKAKYFQKIVEVNNDFEKTVSVKIGNVCIRYSFDKVIRHGDVVHSHNYHWEVQRVLNKDKVKTGLAEVISIHNKKKGESNDFKRTGSNK